MDYEPRELEDKWRSRWREDGRYEADPEDVGDRRPADAAAADDDVTFVTVPYPYPSGGMHIGHARTYTVPDAYARYRRLRGDNVLFPLGWHVTGTPIVGAVERLKKGEEHQLSVLRDTYEVPEDALEDLETPMGFARYFIEEHYKKGMQQLGLSIDWRREFTTNDDRYSKFISWQYETLRDRGLLEKGMHPVKFCTVERQPVTAHDLLEGENAEFQEYTLVKFGWGDAVVPMATLRPETVRGVTNAFVDPEATYVEATVDGERWFASAAAAEKFARQGHDVEVRAEHRGERLVGERVENPVTGEAVLVLPASFVDADNATGVVMSVPAHSPDDWVALEEAKAAADRMREYGVDPDEVRAIEPRSIVDVEGYGTYPAKDAVEAHGIERQDDPKLKEATQELYNREFHAGRLKDMYGEYAGEVIEEVRDRYRDDYRDRGVFDAMYEFTEVVICRCGGDVEVATQETWFLRYNDPEWKGKAKRAVERLDAIPENTRGEYEHTIDWLNEWPCIRNYGLGTRLPWDPEFVIEPLSDSTIYMAYYTIAHRIDDVPTEDLTRAFFDTLFYGAEAVDDPDERALALREEWDYWYPVDYRCSGNDLITNHLTFYLYHHAELFPEPKWPEGIAIMGMGLLEGEKMSSSKGHVVLPGRAIERYGADTVRFFLLNSAEPWQDYDWRADQVGTARSQLDRFWNRALEVCAFDVPDDRPELERIDRWLLSKLQAVIREATEAMDRFETRTASQAAFYDLEEHLRWYRRRTGLDRPAARWVLREVLEARLVMLAPFVPFLANELHEQLTGTSAEDAAWPRPDPAYEQPSVEAEEHLVDELLDDVREVIDVTGVDPDTIHVYAAADWKYRVFDAVAEADGDVGAVMSAVMDDEAMRERGNRVNQVATALAEFAREEPDARIDVLRGIDEGAVYEDAAAFLEREFDATVAVSREDSAAYDPEEKAAHSLPFRPAIYLE